MPTKKKKKSVSKKSVSKSKKRTVKSRKKSVKAKKTSKSKKSVVKSAAGKTVRKPKTSSPGKAKKAPAPVSAKTYQKAPNETELGEVEDYFSHLGVIALTLKDSVALGNTIHVHGHTTDLSMKVDSMQINRVPVTASKSGDSLGIKVTGKCRKGDKVFRVD